jgi:uncharacterized protein YndB with AHSA1/START domain
VVSTVEQEVVIDAPVDVVWRTVTDPEQVVRWFADEVDLRAEPGHDGSMTFASGRTVRVSVRSVEPSRSFSYRWQHPPGTAAQVGNSVLVTFTLAPEGAGTRLRVVETDLDDMGWTREALDAYIAEHTRGWVTHLGRLREHLAERAENRS